MTDYRPYRPKNSYGLAIVIVLLAVFVSFSSFYDLFGVRQLLITAIYPFQFTAAAAWKTAVGIPGSLANLGGLASDNERYRREIKSLKMQQLQLEAVIRENDRLKSALNFQQKQNRFKLCPAQVLGRSPGSWMAVVIIDKGIRSGIRAGMPVINPEGLVGKVVEASYLSSKVLLLLDGQSMAAAVDARTRVAGIIQGDGSGRLRMKYVEAASEIAEGDLIATASISTVFPSGIPIGTVASSAKKEHDIFYNVTVKPAVKFGKLEEVFVVL